MFQYEFIPSNGTDIGSLIAQILCENPAAAAKASKKSVDVMVRIVRRSLGATGSTLFRELKFGFKNSGTSNPLNIAPLQVYTRSDKGGGYIRTGASMAEMLKKYRPYSLVKGIQPQTITTKGAGRKFSGLMQYFMDDMDTNNTNTLEIGLIPSRRGGDKWGKRFSDWQEAGPIKTEYLSRYSRKTMVGYFDRLGMPLKAGTILRRPARPVIERMQNDSPTPAQLFEKLFLERLMK